MRRPLISCLRFTLIASLIGLPACSTRTPERGSAAIPAGVASFQGSPSAWRTSVPVRFVDNRVFVPVVLNDSVSAVFLLDTGANHTVMTPDLARRAGVDAATPTARAKARMAGGQEVDMSVVRLGSISVGTARIANAIIAVYGVMVTDAAGKPIPVDGFLGLDFLSRFSTTIDPHAGKLILELSGSR